LFAVSYSAPNCLRKEKEEFPGIMQNMLPGNSFPQICVVSVKEFVENSEFGQDYVRSMTLSNNSWHPGVTTHATRRHRCEACP
jgi:hypothetical protein